MWRYGLRQSKKNTTKPNSCDDHSTGFPHGSSAGGLDVVEISTCLANSELQAVSSIRFFVSMAPTHLGPSRSRLKQSPFQRFKCLTSILAGIRLSESDRR